MIHETRKNKPFRAIAIATTGSAIVFGVAALLPGCFGTECDASEVPYGSSTVTAFGAVDAGPAGSGIGSFVTPDEWESSPFDGPWINYQHERIIDFSFDDPYNPPADSGIPPRVPYSVTAFISAAPSPNETDDNYTIGSGNVAKWFNVRAGAFQLKNDTCADYYLRVVVDFPPGSATPDAGSDGSTDASTDGGASDGSITVTSKKQ